MVDVERVTTGLRYCSEQPEWNCDKQCPYGENGKKEAGACWVELNRDALALLTEYKELKARHATIVKAADDMYAELKEQRWIPVSERLPEEEGGYIAYYSYPNGTGYKFVGLCHYSIIGFDEKWSWTNAYGFELNVSYWMPLPEPPMMD